MAVGRAAVSGRFVGADSSGAVDAVSRTSASSSPDSTTGASDETCSPSRSRITITPCVERPSRLTSSTAMRITVPPVEISITW